MLAYDAPYIPDKLSLHHTVNHEKRLASSIGTLGTSLQYYDISHLRLETRPTKHFGSLPSCRS